MACGIQAIFIIQKWIEIIGNFEKQKSCFHFDDKICKHGFCYRSVF